MRKLIVCMLMSCAAGLFAQVGKQFPELSGTTLEDKAITLPGDIKGKETIVCLAYSRKAEEALHSWINPLYNRFFNKTDIMADLDDVNLFFVPMFTGIHQPTENMAKKQLKEGTSKEFLSKIICYHGSIKPYKETLGLTDKDEPYFFILDPNGKIKYMTSGFYNDKKLEEIIDHVEE